MRKGNGKVVSGTDVQASTAQVLQAQVLVQRKLIRELTCMFAAHLVYSHEGKAFVPMAIAAETYGDPNEQHGWFVMIDTLEPLGAHRVRVLTSDEMPYVPPKVTPRFELRADDVQSLPKLVAYREAERASGATPERLEELANLINEFEKFQQPEPPQPQLADSKMLEAVPELEEVKAAITCLNTFHTDKNATGLRCSECGSKEKLASA